MSGSTDDTGDLLARSTRALREATAPDAIEGAGDETLARIERSTRAKGVAHRRSRSYTRWVVMPVAASLVVVAAWASASGRLAGWLQSRGHQDEEGATHGLPSALPPPPVSLAVLPSSPPSTSATASAPATPSASADTPEQPAPAARAPAASTPKTSPPLVDADAFYREAHDAHFVRRDPATALAAWDRYLAAAGPSGRFALEARYNRAITLVRLGRREDAARALRPFANGDYGGYRRDEAAQLLRTVE